MSFYGNAVGTAVEGGFAYLGVISLWAVYTQLVMAGYLVGEVV